MTSPWKEDLTKVTWLHHLADIGLVFGPYQLQGSHEYKVPIEEAQKTAKMFAPTALVWNFEYTTELIPRINDNNYFMKFLIFSKISLNNLTNEIKQMIKEIPYESVRNFVLKRLSTVNNHATKVMGP